MTAAEFFDEHHGSHCAPPSPAALFFRWLLRTAKRKPAAPEVSTSASGAGRAGAATVLLAGPYPCCVHCLSGSPCDPADSHPAPCSDGCNAVLRDRMLSEVRADWDKAYPRPTYYGRHDGDVIVDRRNHVHVRPVNGRNLGDLPRRQPAATLNRAPWETGAFTIPADVTLVPAYGQVPVARVLEAERLAGELIT